MSWTPERIEILKTMWSDGKSCSQIAGRLGGVTRNGVIGKVHRLGLSGRATTSRKQTIRLRRTNRATAKAPQIAATRPTVQRKAKGGPRYVIEPPLPELPPPAKVVALLDLEPSQCRWPYGDPKQPGFGFCGCETVPGLSYCEGHAQRAFQPRQVRRVRQDEKQREAA
jgi:GcrA cell cycle regulator